MASSEAIDLDAVARESRLAIRIASGPDSVTASLLLFPDIALSMVTTVQFGVEVSQPERAENANEILALWADVAAIQPDALAPGDDVWVEARIQGKVWRSFGTTREGLHTSEPALVLVGRLFELVLRSHGEDWVGEHLRTLRIT